MRPMKYDIVGDIHGYGEALEALLTDLGYRYSAGAWRHPERHLVFLGDLTDRGPDQLRVIDLARRMVDAGTGSIVMGNHELNALAWGLRNPDNGMPYRDHTPRNRHQHEAFLAAVGEGSDLHRELLGFFASMPLWTEFPAFRAIHACWHPGMMADLSGAIDSRNVATEEGLHRILSRGTPEYKASEVLLKGVEANLPEGLSYLDAQGTERVITRTRWWDASARSFRAAALVEPELASQLPESDLPLQSIVEYDGLKPLFFGHYWMPGEPTLLSDRMACLDFSIALDGYLCAYRHDGEMDLDPAKLAWVGPRATPSYG